MFTRCLPVVFTFYPTMWEYYGNIDPAKAKFANLPILLDDVAFQGQ